MSLTDYEPTNPQRGPKCPMAVLFKQIAPEDAKTIEGWIDNLAHAGTMVAASINSALKDGAVVADVPEITASSVNRHRKRHAGGDHCKCP